MHGNNLQTIIHIHLLFIYIILIQLLCLKVQFDLFTVICFLVLFCLFYSILFYFCNKSIYNTTRCLVYKWSFRPWLKIFW